MYDAILVGVDGSDESTAALEHALGLAATVDAVVHAVTVVEPSGSPMTFGVEEIDEIDRAAARLVDEVVEAHPASDLEVRGDVRRGSPAPILLEYAAEADADVLVVGQRGSGGVAAAVLGSTADELTTQSTRPVTIVPSDDGGGDVATTDD